MDSLKPPFDPSLPSYIDFSNDPIIPLPGLATHTLMYCFLLKADRTALEKVCDQRLNRSSSNLNAPTYAPIGSHVVVILSRMQKACTQDADYKKEKIGWLRETAVQIAIPVSSSASSWPQLFIPYIFIDNPISLVIGREHEGFPKMLGKFDFPASQFQADYFDVSAYGFKCFDRQKPQFPDYFPWMSIRSTANNSNNIAGTWSTIHEAWDALKKELDADLRDLLTPSIDMVFLKQFRDIAQPQTACYQAINEASCQINHFYWGGPLCSTFDITFHYMDSYPIVKDLGLSNTPSYSFWIDADLEFGIGRTIWKAA